MTYFDCVEFAKNCCSNNGGVGGDALVAMTKEVDAMRVRIVGSISSMFGVNCVTQKRTKNEKKSGSHVFVEIFLAIINGIFFEIIGFVLSV